MIPIGDLTVLVPVDVSDPDPPSLGVLDTLEPIEVILLGYFPVPDQAEPALIKHEYESQASDRLDGLVEGRKAVTPLLVFTHDREATIDRVADQYGCEAVLTPGGSGSIDRILVPIRGDANLERIVSVVAGLLHAGEAAVTFFHAVDADDERAEGETLLQETVDRLTAFDVDPDRIDSTLATEGRPRAEIVDLASEYDLVVLGETEPTLRERIIGAVLSRIIDEVEIPALVVRDVP